jgi:NAD(P)-dependent dehydrogenase (short-subunit alcohol dehydrogenase family)
LDASKCALEKWLDSIQITPMIDSKQVAVVTGASTGFGRLIAEALARRGYRVFATMRGVNGRNAGPARELRALTDVVELDVTDDASVERAVADVIAAAGRIDILVNNAGRVLAGVSEAVTLAQAQALMDTNFYSVVRMNRAVLPHMRRERRGLLLHISSGAGRIVLPAMAYYCASKWAMEALAESYRYELAAQHIDSVIIEPGSYKTAIAGNLERAADVERTTTYGSVNGMADTIMQTLEQIAGDPNEIVDAVIRVIETPFGERELRYRVGGGAQGVQQLNAMSAELQKQLLTSFGLAAITAP